MNDHIITPGTAYFGTDTGDWIPAGHITTEGIHIEPKTTQKPSHHIRQQHAMTTAINITPTTFRAVMRNFGIYRLPGDKPLLHNGKTPR